jgi:hypothetical protein
MAIHRLDHGHPLFPNPGGTDTDLSEDERYAFFEQRAVEDWNQLRDERNRLLAETDFMGNSDYPITDAWKTYRQALRDITGTYKNLSEVVWPTKPS